MQGLPVKEWRRGCFLLSTDVTLIDMEAVNSAFASDSMPWAVALPEDLLRTAINSSLCLGLYHCPNPDPQSSMYLQKPYNFQPVCSTNVKEHQRPPVGG